jgi:hypothetical protein
MLIGSHVLRQWKFHDNLRRDAWELAGGHLLVEMDGLHVGALCRDHIQLVFENTLLHCEWIVHRTAVEGQVANLLIPSLEWTAENIGATTPTDSDVSRMKNGFGEKYNLHPSLPKKHTHKLKNITTARENRHNNREKERGMRAWVTIALKKKKTEQREFRKPTSDTQLVIYIFG